MNTKRQEFDIARVDRIMKGAAIGLLALGSLVISSGADACPSMDGSKGVDILIQWNDVALSFFPEHTHVFAHTRELALVHVAMHDAINAIHSHYETYAGGVSANQDASPEAAAAAAAYFISVKLHPELQGYLDGVYADSLTTIPNNQRKKQGIKVGKAAAKQLWELRKHDGANAPTPVYSFPTPGPGVWRPVPPAPADAPPPFPQWRYVDPWAIDSAAQFLAPPPPALTSATFQDDFYELKSIGAAGSLTRTQDQSEAALWWAAQPGVIVINRLGQQLVTDFDMDLHEAARVFALANIVFADVAIANIDSKETHQFWRPLTAITVDYGIPGLSIDPSWTPYLPTPPNQEYPAGHPEGGGATFGVLEHFFGACTLPSPIGYTSSNGVYRTFTNIPDVAEDVITARVAGGMHFRNSGEVGADLGRGIAQWALDHVLQPVDNDCP
jgi:hypothetical protein